MYQTRDSIGWGVDLVPYPMGIPAGYREADRLIAYMRPQQDALYIRDEPQTCSQISHHPPMVAVEITKRPRGQRQRFTRLRQARLEVQMKEFYLPCLLC